MKRGDGLSAYRLIYGFLPEHFFYTGKPCLKLRLDSDEDSVKRFFALFSVVRKQRFLQEWLVQLFAACAVAAEPQDVEIERAAMAFLASLLVS